MLSNLLLKLWIPILSRLTLFSKSALSFLAVKSSGLHSKVISASLFKLNDEKIIWIRDLIDFIGRYDGVPPPKKTLCI